MANPRMTTSVEALLPEGEQVETVALLQTKRSWALPVGVAAFLVVSTALGATDLPRIVVWGIAGGALGVAMSYGTQNWILAGTSRRTVLCKCSQWRVVAVELSEEIPPGTVLSRTGSLINDSYQLGDRRLIASRMFRSRIEEIVAVEA